MPSAAESSESWTPSIPCILPCMKTKMVSIVLVFLVINRTNSSDISASDRILIINFDKTNRNVAETPFVHKT